MNLKDYKQKKERGVSVKELAKAILDNADSYESLLVVTMDSDGTTDIGFSSDSNMALIAMASIAENKFMEDAKVYD